MNDDFQLKEKNIEDSIKDGLITTNTTTGTFFALKAAKIKSPKASLDAKDSLPLKYVKGYQ